ncbi:hypothetical protein BLA39750_00881 [Burkholderia lata]|uniref:Uncharacterized protein n=1 Tax=Burkholderia lata (strain ATCC 17760 / DSM 23089 / LMG 22485 / NCIMB 9086 / R18194 / 383) TaxID=482957 RepID=A0A6P2UM87_BURL3|nr:hypothetical protein [Burkholderia lata]VWC76100.1 hypothetical protein BLA39750_00881 [Burkholderia lata]
MTSFSVVAFKIKNMPINTLASNADLAVSLSRKDNSVIDGTSEPNQVARLVAKLPRNLVTAWQPFVQEGSLTVSAAFCHFKPRVKWSSPLQGKSKAFHSPELADLLLIFDVPQADGSRVERALLIQAKVSSKGSCSLTAEGDLVQRHMYAHWPAFSVLGRKPSVAKIPDPVNIKGGGQSLQSRYACVEDDVGADPAWLIEAGDPTSPNVSTVSSFADGGGVSLTLSESLGDGLARMYAGSLGRRSDQADDWSSLVRYLEEYVVAYTATRKLSHVVPQPGVTAPALTSATTFFAGSDCTFPRYRQVRHLLRGMNDWVNDVRWFQPLHGGGGQRLGYLMDWPGESLPGDAPVDLTEPSFAVIRISVEQPFVLPEMPS